MHRSTRTTQTHMHMDTANVRDGRQSAFSLLYFTICTHSTHIFMHTQWDMTFSRIYFASIFNNTECDCNATLPKHECDCSIGSTQFSFVGLCRPSAFCFLVFVCLSVNSAISLKRMCRANFTCLLLLLLNAINSIKYLFYVKELTLICEWNFICIPRIPRMCTLHTTHWRTSVFAGFRPCCRTI